MLSSGVHPPACHLTSPSSPVSPKCLMSVLELTTDRRKMNLHFHRGPIDRMRITYKAMQQCVVFVLVRNGEVSNGLNSVLKIKAMGLPLTWQ